MKPKYVNFVLWKWHTDMITKSSVSTRNKTKKCGKSGFEFIIQFQFSIFIFSSFFENKNTENVSKCSFKNSTRSAELSAKFIESVRIAKFLRQACYGGS